MENIVLKQIDILRDEMKWWLNVILVTMSALIGGVVSISQDKLLYNSTIGIIGFIIIFFLLYSSFRLKKLNSEQLKLFDKLRRKKWK